MSRRCISKNQDVDFRLKGPDRKCQMFLLISWLLIEHAGKYFMVVRSAGIEILGSAVVEEDLNTSKKIGYSRSPNPLLSL